jgi:hypothetical protein
MPNEQIPENYELVPGPLLGSDSASLIGRGFLVVKRADTSDARYLKASPMVDDITFIRKSSGDQLPERFLEVDMLPAAYAAPHMIGKNAPDILLVCHTRPGLGLCDLVYESATVDRYPKEVGRFFYMLCCFKCCAIMWFFVFLLLLRDAFSSSGLIVFFKMVCYFRTTTALNCLLLAYLCLHSPVECVSHWQNTTSFRCRCSSRLCSQTRTGKTFMWLVCSFMSL